MAIRVYELSKKFGISNKDLLKFLNENGFSINTHMAVLPDEALVLIETKFGPKNQKLESDSQEQVKIANQQEKAPIATKEKQTEPKKEQKIKQEIMQSTQIKQDKSVPFKPIEKIEIKDEPKIEDNKIVLGSTTIVQVSQKANKSVSEIILNLLKKGIVVTKNQVLPDKVVQELGQLYGLEIIDKSKESKQSAIQTAQPESLIVETEGTWKERMPVVVVVGHVDHGKTTLLDFIRKTRVAAKEKGGITQHLGAYEVVTEQGNLVFLDTPGHEAFSLIRARGIKVADIAILVVAADDGVKPQTIEAIKLLKSSQIPVVVALNKVDKATPAQIETTRQQLTKLDLVPEDWGGTTVFMPISAKLGTGIGELLDVIVLQSQLMELKANLSVPAKGYILESKFQKGLGPVGTVICLHGILKVGDYFVSSNSSGRVNALINSYGKRVNSVDPSIPVLVAGFTQLPNSGDSFEVISQKDIKKTLAKSAESRLDIMSKTTTSTEPSINIILKADNVSSKEALQDSINKLSSSLFKKINIIHASIGDVNESDIILAHDTGSLIYSFNVKSQPNLMPVLSKYPVKIFNFDIIYKLLEDLQARSEAEKPIEMVTKKIGEANVLKVFDIKNLGIIAGAVIRSGRFIKDGKVIIWRGKQKVGEGLIKGLQRDRKSVKEVHTGFECAFLVQGFDTWQVDDRVECFQEVPA